MKCKFTKSGRHVAMKFMGKYYLYGGRRVCRHCGNTYTTPQD